MRWLAVNPYVWLAARDRQPVTLAWLVVGGLVLVWVSCLVVWRGAWPSVTNFFITAILLNLALHWIIRYTTAQGLEFQSFCCPDPPKMFSTRLGFRGGASMG